MHENFSHNAIEDHLNTIVTLDALEAELKLNEFFVVFLSRITESYKIPFHTLFSQLGFLSGQLKMPSYLTHALHFFRLHLLNERGDHAAADPIRLRVGIISMLNDFYFHQSTAIFNRDHHLARSITKFESSHSSGLIPAIRFLITEILSTSVLKGYVEYEPSQEMTIVFDPMHTQDMIDHISADWNYLELPIEVLLINSKVIETSIEPELVILNPDFLLDVTAISECFDFKGQNAKLHFLSKFTPKSSSDSLFIGLCANYFLDVLILDSDLQYKDIVANLFKIDPLFIAQCSDQKVKELIQIGYTHFNNIKRAIKTSLHALGITSQNIHIEPSFSNPHFGIQGRLDLLSDAVGSRTIVELKSGKLFKENRYGLNRSHYIQTLLYDLLIKGGKSFDREVKTFILYSALEHEALKYSPISWAQQKEALILRNKIMIQDLRLAVVDANGNDATQVFDIIYQLLEQGLMGFKQRELAQVVYAYESLNPVEMKYFKAFAGFIMREHLIAKRGNLGVRRIFGQAALWMTEYQEKEENYNILAFLTVQSIIPGDNDTLIELLKSPQTNELADFRKGDIVLLYGTDERGSFRWEGRQLFKGTLISNQQKSVVIRLRYRQTYLNIFTEERYWNIEKDLMDSSFNGQFRGLTQWALSDAMKRQVYMGARPPRFNQDIHDRVNNHQEFDYSRIIQKALATQDYFLIWGPPGSGKTHFMIKELIINLERLSPKPILILAYTNRAVDEICDTISSMDASYHQHYVRIGSKYSVGAEYVDRLLEVQIADITNRKDLVNFLYQQKIIVGTVSSIIGKSELLQLLSFEWAIIDEASQILDPQMLEIITKTDRIIMIGDHKQLPSVVSQDPKLSVVNDAELKALGINDLASSMFERLFVHAQKNDWTWAFDKLIKQGRMHQDIMQFPAETFYQGDLEIILPRQAEDLALNAILDPNLNALYKALTQQRVVFYNVQKSNQGFAKMNLDEAELIHQIILNLITIYNSSGLDLSKQSIGIITPFRAQIASISNLLRTIPIELDIMIDTVERFQGGAKDLVIISTVISHPSQLQSIISMNEEGIDRKMNVAITRAREQLIMIGDAEVLTHASHYKSFIERYSVV